MKHPTIEAQVEEILKKRPDMTASNVKVAIISEDEIRKHLTTAREQGALDERKGFIKEINNWFENNFHWGKELSDSVHVTEYELEKFIKTLKVK